MTGQQVSLVDYALAAYRTELAEQIRLRRESEAAGRRKVLALQAMHERAGLTHAEIAELVGLSKPRVGQLLAQLSTKADVAASQ